ncbi:DNA mismatch repair endonuclease MutH [Idiomarina xiamenensis]|uniref:DNA mismatch repair protein MutH n=1 Tax=Idiomarina xiamenensis 10-D-4 TaxID=740709 RepID=K2L669_9GAMM|nr:DNA mismatch repair endonuclease MutH [Idiomarina xiamenensis]EKE85265.1 DNA mismatch repair protein [Idiomarina xiamenensis 10-D-4]
MLDANPDPPQTLDQLFDRAASLAGYRFADLAQQAQLVMPADLRRDKGWVGQLIERYLGASAGSTPQQDFPELGVELKTLPIDELGNPLETTFVCSAPLMATAGLSWLNSNVRNKLQCVLWLPIDGRRQVPLAERVVGSAFLWRPNQLEDAQLQADWEEHMDKISLGEVETISAHHGVYLQLRPKAANGRVLTDAVGADGQPIKALPRGFYLKKDFTRRLLQRAFAEPQD